ncbi:hypothetical protein JOQ06_019240 [Pogonophryne albipinna]|uniref:Uncharacterized protein n=1 Tax=Pogonophryne albipinna TaxID=1090488 RepID=A0AAD6ASY9_9TELE|nr:hypothetical protein JOQ06_019240 [Pogonophryne albipinna]
MPCHHSYFGELLFHGSLIPSKGSNICQGNICQDLNGIKKGHQGQMLSLLYLTINSKLALAEIELNVGFAS